MFFIDVNSVLNVILDNKVPTVTKCVSLTH